MYDWANSVYSLVISLQFFPSITKPWQFPVRVTWFRFWGFRLITRYCIHMPLPFFPAGGGHASPALRHFRLCGKQEKIHEIICHHWEPFLYGTLFFYECQHIGWGIFCSVMASVGYSGSLVFYDAFLPEIVTEDRYDAVSASGYSMGYFGSVILMVVCMLLIMNYDFFGFPSSGLATRFSFLLVGMWWIGFSIVTFRALPDNPFEKKPTGNVWVKGYRELVNVWSNLKHSPDLKKFLIAFFFYNMGVQTIMYLATLFGTDVLMLESSKLIATILLIQLVAALGAWLFAQLSRIKGNKFTLGTMIIIWIMICISAYFITTEYEFYGVAALVGLIMGGIQSLSRATYAKLIPEDTSDHASYFSFYDVTYNVSIVLGTFSFGLIDQVTGSMRNSSLALALYF